MASIKVKFRPSAVADREGTIYYQITHERKVRQLRSNYKVFQSEWDAKRSTVVLSLIGERHEFILSVRDGIREDVSRLKRISNRMAADCTGGYSVDDVIDEFNCFIREYSLFMFMRRLIDRLKTNGKFRTSETYIAAMNSFSKFRHGEDIMIDSIGPAVIEDYEAWLMCRGVVPNTASFYLRILRAVYNRAVEQGGLTDRQPFKHVYTGIDKTVKRALPLKTIRRIKSLDLNSIPALDYARDMFMLSFYLRGMSFVDMAFLRKTDLCNGIVSYRRRKTGQRLIIGWTGEMEAILDKYEKNNSDYLLPIIRSRNINERYAYRNAAYNINRNLKRIAVMLGVDIPLTLYVARHSWATAAKAKGIPLSVISEGMGHDSETTTQIYLSSLDASIVDRANSIIISSL